MSGHFGDNSFRGAFQGAYAGAFGENAIAEPPEPPVTRLFTIGNSGFILIGFETGSYGDLDPSWWGTDSSGLEVFRIVVNPNTEGFQVSQAEAGGSKWEDADQLTIELEGWPDFILTWNTGSFSYEIIDAALVAYIIDNESETLEISIAL